MYSFKDFQKGFEKDQASIGIRVAHNWIWPYAYDREDLEEMSARPDFDPQSRLYCFFEEQMVGFLFYTLARSSQTGETIAQIEFPRILPGHESVAPLLVEKILDRLRDKKVDRAVGRVTTMVPDDIRLAERSGFKIRDWGYKIYYEFKMSWGRLNIPYESVKDIDPENEMDDYASMAALWYKKPLEWCRSRMEAWHQRGYLTHAGVRKNGQLYGACLAAQNEIRPTTAAIYYIFVPDEESLKVLLAKVIDICMDEKVENLIVDLIYEHRTFEPVYRALGFMKAAEWARCEMILR